MPKPNGAYEFVGPVNPRSKRIKPEEWERWKSTITALFLEGPLADVVDRMQLDHGFCANQRQYQHHLTKWGVKKQYRGTTATATPSSATQVDASDPDCRDTLKRHRPSASICSLSSTDSTFPRPPRKRIEQDAARPKQKEPVVSLDDYDHSWCFDESSGTALPSTSAPDTTRNEHIEPPQTPPDSSAKYSVDNPYISPDVDVREEVGSRTAHVAVAPLQSIHPGDSNILVPQWPSSHIPGAPGGISVVSCAPPAPACSTRETASPVASPFLERPLNSVDSPLSPPLESSGVVPTASTQGLAPISQTCSLCSNSPPTSIRTVRAIDRNRPIETFSAQDIRDIKHAVECLSMLYCDHEAFELFTMILKPQILDEECRDSTFWYLIIQCAHTASISEHIDVIQNIIRAEIARLQRPLANNFSLATNILLHMLLAFTHSRIDRDDEAALNIAVARGYVAQSDLTLAIPPLPPDDRSLDLAIYHNILRLHHHEFCDLMSPVPFHFTPLGGELKNKMPFEDWILFQSPGPFELKEDGHMANPCIRSCMSWCQGILSHLDSIPITTRILALCSYEAAKAWAEANSLFIILWEHWMTDDDTSQWTWMTATQESMGIGATELLLIVCRAIHKSYDPLETPADWELRPILQLRQKAEDLAQLPDLSVARAILKEYISRNTVITWPSWWSAVQQLANARVMASLENVLLVRFPNLGATRGLQNSVLVPRGLNRLAHKRATSIEGGQDALSIAGRAQQPPPTLASSLSSADLSAFKKTSTSAMLRVDRLRQASLTTTSILSRPRQRKPASIAGAESISSDISRSLQSLSISEDSAGWKGKPSQVVNYWDEVDRWLENEMMA